MASKITLKYRIEQSVQNDNTVLITITNTGINVNLEGDKVVMQVLCDQMIRQIFSYTKHKNNG